MGAQSGKMLSFMDIYAQLQALRDSIAKFRAFNPQDRQFLETAGQLDAVISSAAAVESAAAPLVNFAPDPRCIRCRGKRSRRTQAAKCSPLAQAYLQYRILDALQPHPAYDSDDGFQPLWIIRSLRFDDDPRAAQALAEFGGRELPIMPIVSGFLEKGTVVQTAFEPWNGDVMLGLPEYLPVRNAAHEERKKLIACLAAKFGHSAGWNEDGTGWLASPCRNCAEICGSVWDLLSYLSAIELSVAKRPRALN
jgi:hypothetical protein